MTWPAARPVRKRGGAWAGALPHLRPDRPGRAPGGVPDRDEQRDLLPGRHAQLLWQQHLRQSPDGRAKLRCLWQAVHDHRGPRQAGVRQCYLRVHL
jgi:hypothetical protein